MDLWQTNSTDSNIFINNIIKKHYITETYRTKIKCEQKKNRAIFPKKKKNKKKEFQTLHLVWNSKFDYQV